MLETSEACSCLTLFYGNFHIYNLFTVLNDITHVTMALISNWTKALCVYCSVSCGVGVTGCRCGGNQLVESDSTSNKGKFGTKLTEN